MSDEQKINGEAIKKPEEQVVGIEVVKKFLEENLEKMVLTLPDFRFTLIAHNTAQNGADIVVSTDDQKWVLEFMKNTIAHLSPLANTH